MKLTFRKHEVKDLSHLQGLVAENPEAVEPGFSIISTSVNFGRSTVELVGMDRHRTPALIALGFTGDDSMLFRMVEAYAWSLEYPESIRRLVSSDDGVGGWPPRVVFIAERLPESFLRKIKLLAFPAVNCFEYRCVEVNGSAGFYLDPVDWAASEPQRAASPASPAVAPEHLETFRLQGPPPALHLAAEHAELAAEHAEPAAAERTKSSRWFGLLASRRETPPSQVRSPESPAEPAEPPASLAASLVPFAQDPIVDPPQEAVVRPSEDRHADPADERDTDRADEHEAGQADEHALSPEWRRGFLERLASTLDAHPSASIPAARTTKPAGSPRESRAEPTRAEPMNGHLEPTNGHAVPTNGHAGFFRNGRAGRHDDGEPRALLDILKLPSDGELAPQWRKFLETPAIDEAKIVTARDYLHREFPMCTIYDFFDHQQNAHVLQLQDAQGKVCHSATIAFEFFDAHRDLDIRAVFDGLRLPSAMREAGQAGVLVKPEGIALQKR